MILCKCMPRFSDTYKYAFANTLSRNCRVFSRLRILRPILNLKITIILDLNELKVRFAMRGIVIIHCNNVKDVRDFCTPRNDNSGEEMFESKSCVTIRARIARYL